MDEDNQVKILEDIKGCYKNGTLVPFIGAGFPKNIEDFPDWDEFVKKDLNNDLGIPENKENLLTLFDRDNIRATEYYVYQKGKELLEEVNKPQPSLFQIIEKGKKELQARLRLKFDRIIFPTSNKNKWQVYIDFINLHNFPIIYTTNWDKTLDDTCKEVLGNDQYSLVISADSLRKYLAGKKKKCLIKYHGDYRYNESIIATQSDYFRRLLNRNILDIKLEHDLVHFNFLFMGFSFKDVFINYTLYQINYMLRQVPPNQIPRFFTIWVEKPNKYKEKYLRLNQINVYNFFKENEISKLEEKEQLKKRIECSPESKDEKRLRQTEKEIQEIIKGKYIAFFDQLKEVE